MALVLTVAILFIYLGYYDFELTLWATNTPTIIKWLPYLTVVLVALFAVAFAYTEKQDGLKAPLPGKTHTCTLPVRIASATVAITLVSTVIAQLAAIGSYDHLHLILVSSSEVYSPIVAVMHVFSLIAAVPAALWFIRLALGKEVNAIYGMVTIAYLLLLTFRIYFDMTTLLSNPRWSFSVFTVIFALLFMLYETRLLISQKLFFLYRALSVTAMAVLAASGITTLVLNMSGKLHEGISCFYSAFYLALAVYIAARLFTAPAETREKNAPAEDVPDEEAESTESPCDEAPEAEEDMTPEEASAPEETPTPEENASFEEIPTPEENTSSDETALPEEAPVEGTEEEQELPDLTPDEVKRLYKAIHLSVAARRGIQETPSEEQLNAVAEECRAVMQALLATEDRTERLSAIRAFLTKSGM